MRWPRLLLTLAIALPAAADFPVDTVAVAIAPGELATPYNGALKLMTPGGASTYLPQGGGMHAVVFSPNRELVFSRRLTGFGPEETEFWNDATTRTATRPFRAASFVYDAAGALYVHDFALGHDRIRKYSMNGSTMLQTFLVPSIAAVEIDLAADQCTLYLGGDAGTIGRFDVCTGTALADLPVAAGVLSAGLTSLRILADGSLLVATGHKAVRLSTEGDLLQTYAIAGIDARWLALALTASGSEFWVAVDGSIDPEALYRVNISTGAVVAGPFPTVLSSVRSLAVAGERRAAIGVVSPVPAIGPLWLLFVSAAIAALAVKRLAS